MTDTSTRGASIEALAEAWASIDGRLERFWACKADADLDVVDGYWSGYVHEAGSLLDRLEERGFTITRMEPTP